MFPRFFADTAHATFVRQTFKRVLGVGERDVRKCWSKAIANCTRWTPRLGISAASSFRKDTQPGVQKGVRNTCNTMMLKYLGW